MKLILSVGLLVVAVLTQAAFAHHEEHDDDSHPCAQGLFKLGEGKIACLALIKRWYHDHESGECKEFDFDGCNKNENNFETKEDCDKTCATWHEAHKDHHHGHHDHHEHAEGKSHDHSDCHGHDHSHNHENEDDHHHEGHAH